VLTIRAATSLLANADSLEALSPLAQALGFTTPMLHASPDALRTLGLDELAAHAHFADGPGHLRLLAAELPALPADTLASDTRTLTRQLCVTLARNAPTRHWCVITLDGASHTLCIACVSPHPNGARVAALRVDRRRVVDSDADTLRALAAAPRDNDALCHARWNDILRRDALSARFYRTLDRLVHTLARTATGHAAPHEREELALLCASRLLFLAFLEAKGWLDGDRGFLLTHCSRQLLEGGRLHERLLRPLFFGTLNTPLTARAPSARMFGAVPFLNGGLFSPTRLERRRRTLRFTDDAITALIGELLDRFRFTAREDSSSWSEAAVDPEMLGRAFECLMATDERRRSGSFYTPPALVEQAVNDALTAALPDCADALSDASPRSLTNDVGTFAHHITALRIIDPACGSGAFLVHMLERLATLLAQTGDTRPTHMIRRDVLTRSIFGVDRNPLAVWLCELRLWLSVVIECPDVAPARIPPLPNLDHHIHAGDTLAAGDIRFAPRSARALTALRNRYTRATGTRKRTLAARLEHEERQRAIVECTRRLDATTHERRDLLERLRQRDLFGDRPKPSRTDTAHLLALRTRTTEQRSTLRKITLGAALPFRFAAHFADVAAAGFDIVIGNPPWVRPHNLPLAERTQLRAEYFTLRHAAWKGGALRAGAGAGFSAQADLAVAFVERSIGLLKPRGVIALLLPAKLWRALAGGGVREFIAQHTTVRVIRDWSDAHALFDAAVYPSLLVAERTSVRSTNHSHDGALPAVPLVTADSAIARASARPNAIHVAVTRRLEEHTFSVPTHELPMGGDPAAPWLLLPHTTRHAFNRLRQAGPALGDSALGRPLLGVKCGLNAAFLVHATEHDDETATIESEDNHALIERILLRPALRGEAIRGRAGNPGAPDNDAGRCTSTARALRIVWTHAADGTPLRTLPPRASRWLAHYRPKLETRRDARSHTPWWSLFRTEAARHERSRLVWADLGKRLRTTILEPGDPTVPLNSCYVLPTPSLDDAYALNALLTSPVAAAWLDAIAEPARGGYRRFLGWTVAALPIPNNWHSARPALASFGRRLTRHSAPDPLDPIEHTALVADAYDIPVRALKPLVNWFER
jgi:hypothetical protein